MYVKSFLNEIFSSIIDLNKNYCRQNKYNESISKDILDQTTRLRLLVVHRSDAYRRFSFITTQNKGAQ